MNIDSKTMRIILAVAAVACFVWASVNLSNASQVYAMQGSGAISTQIMSAVIVPVVGAIVAFIGSLSISTVPKELLTIASLAAIGQQFPDIKPQLKETAQKSLDILFDQPHRVR